MSWFSPNRPPSPHRSSSHSHSHSHHQPSSQSKNYYYTTSSTKHPSSSHNKSNGYFYTTSSRGSASRARPRDGYVNRLMSQIKRYLRQLYSYARRHPVKLLMMILPLLTGGALTGILAKFGIRLPRGLENMVGGGRHSGRSGSSFGGAEGVQGLMKIAQQFM